MRLLRGHKNSVRCLAYSPDGRLLASGSEDRTVRLWDVATGETIRVLNGPRLYPRTLAFSPEGSMLAGVGRVEEGVFLWDVDSGARREIHPWGSIDPLDWSMTDPQGLAFAPVGLLLFAAGPEMVVLLRPDTGEVLGSVGGGRSLAVSANGRFLATLGSGGITVYGPDETRGETLPLTSQRWLRGSSQRVAALAFDRTGSFLTSAAAEELFRWDLWTEDITSVERGTRLPTPPGGPLLLSSDGNVLFTGDAEAICAWEITAGRELARFDWGIGPVLTAALAPDGMTAAAAGRDLPVVLWDVDF